MKLFQLYVSIFIISCFAGCIAKNPAKLWFYTHSLGNSTVLHSELNPTSFINLKPGGSYTCDFGSFQYGKWVMKDEELLLTNTSNITTKFPVKYIGTKDLQVVTGEGSIVNFEAQPSSFKSVDDDPFSLSNNKWRIRATHKESEQEIRNRLINHCKFWVAYFNWANDSQLQVVDVRSTPTLIKIYGNGFGLKPYDELPDAWRSYFFDSEDCKIANNIMYEVFEYHQISWAHTDNKYKMFIGALQQLQQYL